jgi:hypothetical protein
LLEVLIRDSWTAILLIDLLGWQQVWVNVKLMEVIESNSDGRNIQLQMKFMIGRSLVDISACTPACHGPPHHNTAAHPFH